MPFFTVEEVTALALEECNVKTTSGIELIAQYYSLSKAVEQLNTRKFDIFLSHPYKDKIIVIGIYTLLVSAGYKVYVDWIQDQTSDISSDTAKRLRDRMKQCDCLLYATTDNHTASKWMPWEAGFFHGYDGHVAILPVVKNNQTFQGQEYLSLYPYAEKSYLGAGKDSLKITDQKDSSKYTLYTNWISTPVD